MSYVDSVLVLSVYFSINLCWCCDAVSDQSDLLRQMNSRFSIKGYVGLIKDFRERLSSVSSLISPQTSFLAPQIEVRHLGTSLKMEEQNNLCEHWAHRSKTFLTK